MSIVLKVEHVKTIEEKDKQQAVVLSVKNRADLPYVFWPGDEIEITDDGKIITHRAHELS